MPVGFSRRSLEKTERMSLGLGYSEAVKQLGEAERHKTNIFLSSTACVFAIKDCLRFKVCNNL